MRARCRSMVPLAVPISIKSSQKVAKYCNAYDFCTETVKYPALPSIVAGRDEDTRLVGGDERIALRPVMIDLGRGSPIKESYVV